MKLEEARKIQKELGIENEFLCNQGDLKAFRANAAAPKQDTMWIFFEKGIEEVPPENDERHYDFVAMYRDAIGTVKTEIEYSEDDW